MFQNHHFPDELKLIYFTKTLKKQNCLGKKVVFVCKVLLNACTQAAIRFFTVKYEISQLHPNGHSIFYSEIRNFTVVPKRPFVFSQRSTKFYSCTETAILFLTAKYEILQFYPNGLSFFYSEMKNFKNCTQTAIRFSQQNKKFSNVPKLPFIL